MSANAIRHFWSTRVTASEKQKLKGASDQGNRSAVTSGKNLDGFVAMMRRIIMDNGLAGDCIYTTGRVDITLPGYFRPTKNWDLLVVNGGQLVAAIEFKSMVGSFGNNFNNRVEEALGSATDLLTAYREGAFGTAPKPFLGFVFVLQEVAGSMRPVSIKSTHF